MTDQTPMTPAQRSVLNRVLADLNHELVYVRFLAGSARSDATLEIQTLRKYNDGSVFRYTTNYDEDGFMIEDDEYQVSPRPMFEVVGSGYVTFPATEQDASLV